VVGVRLLISTTITATGESTIYSVPDPYIAFLRRLIVSNGATALATVQIICYNGDAKKPVLTLKVPAGQTLILSEDSLPVEACPTRIALSTDQQPLNVDVSIELE
jgi:hypothetical protein